MGMANRWSAGSHNFEQIWNLKAIQYAFERKYSTIKGAIKCRNAAIKKASERERSWWLQDFRKSIKLLSHSLEDLPWYVQVPIRRLKENEEFKKLFEEHLMFLDHYDDDVNFSSWDSDSNISSIYRLLEVWGKCE